MSYPAEAFSPETVDRDGLADWPVRLRELGRLALAYALLVAVGTALGLLVVRVLEPGALGGWDDGIATWFEANRTARLDGLSNIGSGFADTINVVAAGLVAVAVLTASWRRWGEVAVLLTGLLLEVTAFVTITHLVGRDRPDIAKLDPAPPTSSFPSGHTAAAVVLWGGLALILAYHFRHQIARVIFAGLATVLVVAVALSRMYRGMHHLTDVVAGALLGAACLAVAVWVVADGVARQRGRGPAEARAERPVEVAA